ncbi:hypothetical protein BH11ACT3_BH11ACT3_03680 [soil metagenome]
MLSRSVVLIPVLIIGALTLSGCGGDATPPAETVAPSDTPTPTPTPTAAGGQAKFSMPTTCTELLPQSRLDAFAGQNLELLGGPGGLYPNYYTDPTPEEQAGGISCIWGDETVPESTIEVSVAPLSTATRGGVVDNLISQGLNEATLADGISYAQIGDETSAPAVLNVIRNDSWISVLEALGGEAFFDEATQIADEVKTQVYAG